MDESLRPSLWWPRESLLEGRRRGGRGKNVKILAVTIVNALTLRAVSRLSLAWQSLPCSLSRLGGAFRAHHGRVWLHWLNPGPPPL
jgi:hypothetical protein